jgi:hypothetical protein
MRSRLHPVPRCLRLLALALLVLGLLVNPVLAAGCELKDMRLALGGSHEVVVDAADPGEDACCPGQVCGACCTAVTVMPLATAPALMARVIGGLPAAALVEPGPAPRRAEIRPPIVA